MGDVRVEETEGGSQVFLRGRPLYSPHPRSGAERRASALPIRPDTIVVVLSPLLGYGLQRLLDRLPDRCAVLAIELEPTLHRLTQRALADITDARLHLCGPSLGEIGQCVHALIQGSHRRVVEISLSAGALLHRTRYREITAAIESQLRTHWQNRATIAGLGRRWIANLFSNLARASSSQPFELLRTTRPVIACGAGPSLEAALPLIRTARRHAVLLAADTALPALLDHAIIPDLVVAVDAQYTNVLDFVPHPRGRYTLAADLTSGPAVISAHQAQRTVVFCTEFAPLPLLARLRDAGLVQSFFEPVGSVGVTTVQLALTLTDGPVLLAGHDLAFTAARTHARGTYADIYYRLAQRRTASQVTTATGAHRITVDGKSGPVQTDLRMNGYAEQLRHLVQRSHRVFDLGTTGIDFDAQPLDASRLIGLLGQSTGTREPIMTYRQAAAPTGDRHDAAVRFLRQEVRLLEQLLRHLDDHLHESTVPSRETQMLLSACSYVTDGFTGATDGPFPPARARTALVNAMATRDRIVRVTLRRS